MRTAATSPTALLANTALGQQCRQRRAASASAKGVEGAKGCSARGDTDERRGVEAGLLEPQKALDPPKKLHLSHQVTLEQLTGTTQQKSLPKDRDTTLIPLSTCKISAFPGVAWTEMQVGMLLFVPMGTCRTVSVSEGHSVLLLGTSPQFGCDIEANHQGCGSRLPDTAFLLQDLRQTGPLVPMIRRFTANYQPDAAFALETLGSLLLNELVLAHAAKFETLNQPKLVEVELRHLKNIDRFIDDNIEGPIRIADLAAMVDMTRHQFIRYFKRATGMSCVKYVHGRRLQHARRLLEDGGESLADVAFAAGFSSQSHFSNIFKHFFTVTPREFVRLRRQAKAAIPYV